MRTSPLPATPPPNFGLPTTQAGQLEHSRQHRDEHSEHTLVGYCPVAERVVGVETEAADAERIAATARVADSLRRWNATHANSCRASILGPDARCTCGLSAALAEAPVHPLDVERLVTLLRWSIEQVDELDYEQGLAVQSAEFAEAKALLARLAKPRIVLVDDDRDDDGQSLEWNASGLTEAAEHAAYHTDGSE